MTKANKDKLPLGFDDHYLIQGLRDQVEELQGALLRATEELNEAGARSKQITHILDQLQQTEEVKP